MDPLTVTTGLVSLVAQCIKIGQSVQSYCSKYKLANLSIAATLSECSAIRIALLQIQSILLTRNEFRSTPSTSGSGSLLAVQELEVVLGASSLAFGILNERLSELIKVKTDRNHKATFKTKLTAVWNDEEVKQLRSNIQGQAIAINLLLAAFQAETVLRAQETLEQESSKKILKNVAQGNKTLISISDRASTIVNRRRDGDIESIVGDEIFDFDDVIINSTVYRRAFLSQTSRKEETSLGKEDGGKLSSHRSQSLPVGSENAKKLQEQIRLEFFAIFHHYLDWVGNSHKHIHFEVENVCEIIESLPETEDLSVVKTLVEECGLKELNFAKQEHKICFLLMMCYIEVYRAIISTHLDDETRQKPFKQALKSVAEYGNVPKQAELEWLAATDKMMNRTSWFRYNKEDGFSVSACTCFLVNVFDKTVSSQFHFKHSGWFHTFIMRAKNLGRLFQIHGGRLTLEFLDLPLFEEKTPHLFRLADLLNVYGISENAGQFDSSSPDPSKSQIAIPCPDIFMKLEENEPDTEAGNIEVLIFGFRVLEGYVRERQQWAPWRM